MRVVMQVSMIVGFCSEVGVEDGVVGYGLGSAWRCKLCVVHSSWSRVFYHKVKVYSFVWDHKCWVQKG